MPRAEARLLAIDDERSRGGFRRGALLGGDCGARLGEVGRVEGAEEVVSGDCGEVDVCVGHVVELHLMIVARR